MSVVVPLRRRWKLKDSDVFTNFVPDDGPTNAEILLIGEAPGRVENTWSDRFGNLAPKPFVGPSGKLINFWWESVGLVRRCFRITNVFPYWPPFEDIKKAGITKEEWARYVEQLHEKIAKLPNLRIIVPTGNTALAALTGKRPIGRWRGSIMSYTDRNGRVLKVIPTLHPAGFFREPNIERRCKLDWARIAGELDSDEFNLPVRQHIVAYDEATQFTKQFLINEEFKQRIIAWRDRLFKLRAEGKVKYLSTDIENIGPKITCVGFAYSSKQSITIPLDDGRFWQKDSDRLWAWSVVKELIESDLEKVLQNGLYDVFWFQIYGIKIKNWFWDTLAMHHCIDSSDSHSLEYMASVDTREPFWKTESKEAVGKDKKIKDWPMYWRYNGKDCCVTLELFFVYLKRLRELKLVDFYHQHYRKMFTPLMGMMLRGINIDNKLRKKTYALLQADMLDVEDDLEDLAGYALKAKKVLSREKVVTYLFDELKLPVVFLTKTDRPSTDIISLRTLLLRYQQKILRAQNELNSGKRITARRKDNMIGDIGSWQIAVKALSLILRFRKLYQTSTFFADSRVDEDGRMRCTFHFNTVFGRLSSSKSPNGSGTNLQNQQRDTSDMPSVRQIFRADPGCFIIEPDLSQAESRVVGMLSRDKELIRLARTPSWEFDVHTYNASIIFKIELDELTRRIKAKDKDAKDLRQCAKRAVHGSNYLMTGPTLADVILKESGLVRTPDECQAMIDDYIAGMPGVAQYHELTWEEVLLNGYLKNTWGRIFHFEHARKDQACKRDACAARPQGEVPDIINQWGLIPAHWRFAKTKEFYTLAQVHDSMPYNAPLKNLTEAYESMKWLRESLERPRMYYGEPMTIWCSFKIGMTLAGDYEFEKFPDFKQFKEGVGVMLDKHKERLAA